MTDRATLSARCLIAIALPACAPSDSTPVSMCGDPARGPALDRFVDVTGASGAAFQYMSPDYRGAGLAVADLDGDGLPEIVAGRRTGGVALFRNLGALRFAPLASGIDETIAASAIAAADLDNDGDRDLVLAGPGVAYVMANAGDGSFHEVARFADSGTTEHVLPTDLDGDGLLDLYFANRDLTSAAAKENRLYLNRGGLQFQFAGIVGTGLSWSTTAFDRDGDGDQDLYVANDTLLADFGVPGETTTTLQPDAMFRNDGPGPDGIPQFVDIADELGLADPRSSMGGTLGDYDDDGTLDLYVPNLGAKKMFLRTDVAYAERAAALGVDAISRVNPVCPPGTLHEDCLVMSWSAAFTDFDLDGTDELLVVNGVTGSGILPPALWFARDADGDYHEMSPDLGCLDARALAVADLDADGDLDLAIGQSSGPLVIEENRGKPARDTWLRVLLSGSVSNREGVGALVTAYMASGRVRVKAIGAGGVVHSAWPAEAFYGLGDDRVDRLVVRWPSGRVTEVNGPMAGIVRLDER